LLIYTLHNAASYFLNFYFLFFILGIPVVNNPVISTVAPTKPSDVIDVEAQPLVMPATKCCHSGNTFPISCDNSQEQVILFSVLMPPSMLFLVLIVILKHLH
jgi:hypothetical protein